MTMGFGDTIDVNDIAKARYNLELNYLCKENSTGITISLEV